MNLVITVNSPGVLCLLLHFTCIISFYSSTHWLGRVINWCKNLPKTKAGEIIPTMNTTHKISEVIVTNASFLQDWRKLEAPEYSNYSSPPLYKSLVEAPHSLLWSAEVFRRPKLRPWVYNSWKFYSPSSLVFLWFLIFNLNLV